MDVYIREDVTVDEFIDVLIGNRRYIRCLYVYNKIDTISMEEVDRIAREPNSIVISCEKELNLDGLKMAVLKVSKNSRMQGLITDIGCSNLRYGGFIQSREGKQLI
jgi:ribosome-interacting GTPase 1